MNSTNQYGETETICPNSKYSSAIDSYTCHCCTAKGGDDTQAKDLELWQEVILKSENTIWYISSIVDSSLTLVPTKSPRHKNAEKVVYDFMVKPYTN